jgi:hypothetical protein
MTEQPQTPVEILNELKADFQQAAEKVQKSKTVLKVGKRNAQKRYDALIETVDSVLKKISEDPDPLRSALPELLPLKVQFELEASIRRNAGIIRSHFYPLKESEERVRKITEVILAL